MRLLHEEDSDDNTVTTVSRAIGDGVIVGHDPWAFHVEVVAMQRIVKRVVHIERVGVEYGFSLRVLDVQERDAVAPRHGLFDNHVDTFGSVCGINHDIGGGGGDGNLVVGDRNGHVGIVLPSRHGVVTKAEFRRVAVHVVFQNGQIVVGHRVNNSSVHHL